MTVFPQISRLNLKAHEVVAEQHHRHAAENSGTAADGVSDNYFLMNHLIQQSDFDLISPKQYSKSEQLVFLSSLHYTYQTALWMQCISGGKQIFPCLEQFH